MKENDFHSKRLGKLVWVDKGMYYRFEPKLLPFKLERQAEIETQAQKAAVALGRVSGLMRKFTQKEIDLFQTPFILKEAALSSEIEGTRSTITDIYREEKIKEPNPDKREDNQEVRNYRDALSWALDQNPETITEDFIKEIHRILMKGVRGHDKDPGKYKEHQNAIGRREDSLDSAKFVPASPETTPRLMKNLIEFINSNDVSPLTKIAIVHYQFETIHPFKDGNGRIGRLLISLQLCREGFIPRPLIYVSEYFSRNRDTYIDFLFYSSSEGKIEDLVKFILKALEAQADSALDLIVKIDNYKVKLYSELKRKSKSPNLHELVEFLFRTPVFRVNDVKDYIGVSQPSAWTLVQLLKAEGIITEMAFSQKDKVYFAREILNILEGRS